MTDTVTLTIAGTTSTIATKDLTIERIIAEAHSLGYGEFSVFCNDKEVIKPENLKIVAGAHYIIADAAEELIMDNIEFEVTEEENEPK
jgi:hypothetical protein